MTDDFASEDEFGKSTPQANRPLTLADFVDVNAVGELPDPQSVIRFLTTGAGEKYVPAEGPMTIGEALQQCAIAITGAVQYWLNGVQVNIDAMVNPGDTVTIVGSVKGG